MSEDDTQQRDAQLRELLRDLLSRRLDPFVRELGNLQATSNELFTRLLEDARSSTSDQTADVEGRVRAWFSESEHAFQEQLAEVRREAIEALRADRATFNEVIAEIDRQRTQAGVLSTMIEAAGRFAPRVAFFVVRSGTVIGWKAHGFENGLSDDTVGQLAAPIASQTLLTEALSTKSTIVSGENTDPAELSFLGEYAEPQARRAAAVPLVVRGKAAAVLYADSGEGEELDLQRLEALLRVTGMAIELLPIRRSTEQFSRLQTSHLQGVVEAAAPPDATGQEAAQSAVVREDEGEQQARLSNRREHLDARRYARFLIADIKLYKPAKVADGRRRADLYDRLKDEIERSRALYEKHVSPLVTAQADYFYDELVLSLAEGDSSKLGRNSPWSAG